MHRYRLELAHLPAGQTTVYPYAMRTFRSGSDVPALHALLNEAYAPGGGLGPCAEWWQVLSSDPEFDARLVFLVMTPTGTLAAAGIAWSGGVVKDLVVAPGFRRLGLAASLLAHICRVFRERRLHAVELTVAAGNHAAIALYESMGMRRLEPVST